MHSQGIGHLKFEGITIDEAGKLKFETLPLINLKEKSLKYEEVTKKNDLINCLNLVQALYKSCQNEKETKCDNDDLNELIQLDLFDKDFCSEKMLVILVFILIIFIINKEKQIISKLHNDTVCRTSFCKLFFPPSRGYKKCKKKTSINEKKYNEKLIKTHTK